ncbi:unnamed protein product [Absidia cylindrospora]
MQQAEQKLGPPLPTIHSIYRNDVNIPLIATSYFVLSICSIFAKDYLTTTSEYRLQYPLFTLLLQLATALALIQLWKWCLPRRNPRFLRFYSLSTTGWKAALPATGIYTLIVVLDIHFLTRIPVTMYSSMHASCVLITLAMGMLFVQKKYRRRQRGRGHWMATMPVWTSCLIQYLGVWFSGATDGIFTFKVNGVCYTLLLALYGYSIQKALVTFRNDVSQFLQWHLILATMVVLSMVLALDDFSAPYQFLLTLDQVNFWTQMVTESALVLSLHILMVLLIDYTSPLSYAVASTVKTCIQAILALYVMKSQMNGYQLVCLLISLIGAVLYSRTSTTKHIDTVYSM